MATCVYCIVIPICRFDPTPAPRFIQWPIKYKPIKPVFLEEVHGSSLLDLSLTSMIKQEQRLQLESVEWRSHADDLTAESINHVQLNSIGIFYKHIGVSNWKTIHYKNPWKKPPTSRCLHKFGKVQDWKYKVSIRSLEDYSLTTKKTQNHSLTAKRSIHEQALNIFIKLLHIHKLIYQSTRLKQTSTCSFRVTNAFFSVLKS